MTRTGLLLAALVVAASVPARADDAADKRAASALLDDAAKLLAKGDYDGALDLFRRAYATYPSPKIFLDFGTTYKKMGRAADAANEYQRYLDQADPPAARKAEVTKILADLDRSLGFVTITVSPGDGAELQVAGGDWRPANELAKWRVTPGDVTVAARRVGSKPGESHATVPKGATVAVAITLVDEEVDTTPETPPQPPQPPQPPTVVTPAARAPRFAITGRALIDGKLRGGAGAIGGVAVIGPVDLEAAAIVGPTYGGYAGAALSLTHGSLRPRLAAGVPFYVSDGARWAARVAAGASWRATARIGVLAELGLEYYLNPEPDIDTLQFVPVLGVEGWL